MQRNVCNGIASSPTKQLSNCTKLQLHALMTINSKKRNWDLLENWQKYALRLSWNAFIWHASVDLISYGQQTNLREHPQNGPKHVTNDDLVRSLTFIIHVNTNSIAMWETLPNNADWDCFKTPILQEILRTQNLLQEEHCAFSEVTRLFQSAGCVRNKLQCRTVQPNQKSFLWMQDWDWTGFLLSMYVLGNTIQTPERPGRPVVNDKDQRSQGTINVLNHIDCVPSNVQFSHHEALLYVFEDNEAVIKMIIKGRSPTVRHVSSTHTVALDWVFDRINLDHQDPSNTLTPKTNLPTF